MAKYYTIGVTTLALIIELVSPLVGLGLGISTSYHDFQLFQRVQGKAKCTSPLDICGSDRTRFLKARKTILFVLKLQFRF